jgi:hypothetical protein
LDDAEAVVDCVLLGSLFFEFSGEYFQRFKLVLDRTFINITFQCLLQLVRIRIRLRKRVHSTLSQLLRNNLTFIIIVLLGAANIQLQLRTLITLDILVCYLYRFGRFVVKVVTAVVRVFQLIKKVLDIG